MTKRSLLPTLFLFLLACCFSPLFAQNYNDLERGTAVYYADYLAGQRTAYGDIYRPNEMTAAHRNHPLNTLLRVTRFDNRRSVIVRVNDRGPFCEGCVIDLSKAAAMELDLVRSGRAPVSVEVVRRPQLQADAGNTQNRGIALYEQPSYNAPANANRNSTYPRPNSDIQSRSIYSGARPSTYSNERAVRINTTPSTTNSTANPDARRARDLQERGLNAYNQVEAFDSYNYYQAQRVEQRTANTSDQTEQRLRERGLLTEGEAPDNSTSFYNRAGVQRPQPQSYSAESSSLPAQLSRKSVSPRGSYAVQLASYRSFDNAQRQLQKLKQEGLATAYLLESSNSGGKLYKVLNGPFIDKVTAYNELQRYKKDLLLDGIVILLK